MEDEPQMSAGLERCSYWNFVQGRVKDGYLPGIARMPGHGMQKEQPPTCQSLSRRGMSWLPGGSAISTGATSSVPTTHLLSCTSGHMGQGHAHA